MDNRSLVLLITTILFGLPGLFFSYRSLQDMKKSKETLGKLFAKEVELNRLIKEYGRLIEEVKKALK